jgi:hypothetical protein
MLAGCDFRSDHRRPLDSFGLPAVQAVEASRAEVSEAANIREIARIIDPGIRRIRRETRPKLSRVKMSSEPAGRTKRVRSSPSNPNRMFERQSRSLTRCWPSRMERPGRVNLIPSP